MSSSRAMPFTRRRRRVVVIGAGVIGLSVAVHIAENNAEVDVEVVADRLSPDTTSDGAGGIWAPQFGHSLKGTVLESKLRHWATQTWERGLDMARGPEAARAGISLIPYYKGYHLVENKADHWWRDVVMDYRQLADREREIMLPGTRDAYVFTTILTDCTIYLPYLTDRLLKAGGKITKRKVLSLQEFVGKCDVVVNCTGVGARGLAKDPKIQPARGQTLQVEAPWIRYVVEVVPSSKNYKSWPYIIPRVREVVLGGTNQAGCSVTTVEEKDKETILAETSRFMPSLKDAKIKRSWAGLRPSRSTGLRLEKETIRDGDRTLQVVHNYGHDGNGITVHWGCAQEVSNIVKENLGGHTTSKL